jgi:hypothetical protein
MKDLIWMNRNEVGRIGVCAQWRCVCVCVCVHALCQTLQVGLYYTGRVMTLWIPYVSWEDCGALLLGRARLKTHTITLIHLLHSFLSMNRIHAGGYF